MEYKDKLKQCDREAIITLLGLIATIIVWTFCGFGLCNSNLEIFNLPIWIVAGCGGTFLFAVAFVLVMTKFVMKDVGLDDIAPLDQK